MTALYWIYRNSSAKYVGISHYRRFFYNGTRFKRILVTLVCNKVGPISEKKLDKWLHKGYDWVLPQKNLTNKTVYENYKEAHYEEDILNVRSILTDLYPQYVYDFDAVMEQKGFSAYNMFYTNEYQFKKYCDWLFPMLFELEKRLDISSYDNYQSRVFGFISERLLNIYIRHQKVRVKYLSVFNKEENSRQFILRKLFHYNQHYK